MAKVTMPQLGESVAEGTIGRWLKKLGDRVEKYEPLVEVITDKVNAEVPSPVAGILTAILVEEGTTVPNNAEIAEIAESEGATVSATPAPVAAPAAGGNGSSGTATRSSDAGAAAGVSAMNVASAATAAAAAGAAVGMSQELPMEPAAGRAPAGSAVFGGPAPTVVPGERAAPAPSDPDARMTPAVRRLLREHGLSASQVTGTGGGGRITREDVLAVVEAIRVGGAAATPAAGGPGRVAAPTRVPAAPAGELPGVVFPPGADEVLVPVTLMRRGIAAQMTRALAVPHAYVHVEVDMTALVRLRDSLKARYEAREGIGLSYVPFVVKATAEALRRHPTLNANWTEAGLMAKRRINMGVAVAVPDGLIVPVIRDVDGLSIHGINRAIAEVAARARASRLRVDDFGGGTFTIDNTGWFGSNLTMPIINVPEVAILTMEVIKKRAVVVETPQGDSIAIRPVMNVVIGIDHRATDGAQAGAFLRDVRLWLEGVGPDTAIV